MPQFVDGIAGLSAQYDGFILDVWGVLHNGVRPYPHVIETLQQLRAARKRVILLSNAPARAKAVLDRIEKIGIPRDLVDGAMSSGEEVWQCLSTRPDAFYAGLGSRCLWLGPDRHTSIVEDVGLTLTDDPAQADFILNSGPDGLDDAATRLLPTLRASVEHGLPMVCANPDLHVIEGENRIVCAGQVAKVYEALGGTVRWHGKPFGSVYQSSLKMLGIDDKRRVIAIGDSLRTDIAGATAAGLDCMLIAGGIHADEFGMAAGATPDLAKVENAIGNGPRPTYLAREFAW